MQRRWSHLLFYMHLDKQAMEEETRSRNKRVVNQLEIDSALNIIGIIVLRIGNIYSGRTTGTTTQTLPINFSEAVCRSSFIK